MTKEVWFWLFYVLALFFSMWTNYDRDRPWFRWGGAHLVQFILLGILGYAVFGAPVK